MTRGPLVLLLLGALGVAATLGEAKRGVTIGRIPAAAGEAGG